MTEKTAEQIAAEQAEAQRKADEKAAEKARKEAEKAEAKAAREANRMPEQNGIRRPKPDTLCGKAWGIFDSVSQKNGAPASICESMELAKADGLNEANVRAEYARWRKFHGITGRIESPKAETTSAGTEQA
jgi:membrane protein involved in colicin uptake